MEPNYALHYAGDIVGSALRRAAKILDGHKTEMNIPADLPMVRVDPVLFEQVIFNLLDNAAKYAPEGSVIHIEGWADADNVVVQISDEGPGIPLKPISTASSIPSTACARAIRCALKHRAWPFHLPRLHRGDGWHDHRLSNRTGRPGAVFTIRLPKPNDIPKLDELR